MISIINAKPLVRKQMEYELITRTMKSMMKARKVTYARLAAKLGLSEITIKRTLNAPDGNLARLVDICSVLNTSFYDLVALSKTGSDVFYPLPAEAENFFALHIHYFQYFILLYEAQMSVVEIEKEYKLTKKSTARYLQKLEQLKLIERLAGDKIKFLCSGIILLDQTKALYAKAVGENFSAYLKFMTDAKTPKNEFQRIFFGEIKMRPETLKNFVKELNFLEDKYSEIAKREMDLVANEKLKAVTYLMTAAPFKFRPQNLPAI